MSALPRSHGIAGDPGPPSLPSLDQWVAALQASGCNPRKSGSGFDAFCPVHERDGQRHQPSLHVERGSRQEVVATCHACCTFDDVRDALGFRPELQGTLPGMPAPQAPDSPVEPLPRPWTEAERQRHKAGPIVSRYDYRDESGVVLFQVTRHDGGSKGKTFRQWTPGPDGSWFPTVNGARQVPFRLPELMAAGPNTTVFVVEGEKDVLALVDLGLVATCNASGAGKWGAEHSAYFPGRPVVILPDNDEPGAKHAITVAQALLGIAASVRVVNLPDLPPKGDVPDWIAAGGTAERLQGLVQATTPLQSSPLPKPRDTLSTIELGELLKLEFPEPRWAVPDLIPEGLTLLYGAPKLGKSFLGLAYALSIAYGGAVMGNPDRTAQPGSVLYLAMEDGPRRLQGRIRRIMSFYGMKRDDPARCDVEFLDNRAALPRLSEGLIPCIERWHEEHPDARLVVIDTLGRVRKAVGGNRNAYQHDTEEIGALQAMAVRRGLGIVCVHHARKGGSEDSDFVDAISGTAGIGGVADAIIYLTRSRGQGDAVLQVTGRDLIERDIALKRTTLGTADDGAIVWTEVCEAEDIHLTPERLEIVKALRELLVQGRASIPPVLQFKPSEIASHLGHGDSAGVNRLQKLLKKLIESGDVKYGPRSGTYTLPVLDPHQSSQSDQTDQSGQSDQSSGEGGGGETEL